MSTLYGTGKYVIEGDDAAKVYDAVVNSAMYRNFPEYLTLVSVLPLLHLQFPLSLWRSDKVFSLRIINAIPLNDTVLNVFRHAVEIVSINKEIQYFSNIRDSGSDFLLYAKNAVCITIVNLHTAVGKRLPLVLNKI